MHRVEVIGDYRVTAPVHHRGLSRTSSPPPPSRMRPPGFWINICGRRIFGGQVQAPRFRAPRGPTTVLLTPIGSTMRVTQRAIPPRFRPQPLVTAESAGVRGLVA